jgi:predicted nucleic acid-binding protein
VSFLLDTNVISELRKGVSAHPNVLEWFSGVAEEDIHLSVLVMGELRRGVERIRKRDSRQAAALERWVRRALRDHGDRILPVDFRVAEQWGRLTAMRSGSVIDALMAATAQVFGLVLVTRNVKDVAWTGVSHLNPFEAAPPDDA